MIAASQSSEGTAKEQLRETLVQQGVFSLTPPPLPQAERALAEESATPEPTCD